MNKDVFELSYNDLKFSPKPQLCLHQPTTSLQGPFILWLAWRKKSSKESTPTPWGWVGQFFFFFFHEIFNTRVILFMKLSEFEG